MLEEKKHRRENEARKAAGLPTLPPLLAPEARQPASQDAPLSDSSTDDDDAQQRKKPKTDKREKKEKKEKRKKKKKHKKKHESPS